jgi:very-short-patch-repair endonuclease
MAETLLMNMLQVHSPILNMPIATKLAAEGYPTHYKIDVAIPGIKLAVEADGSSHFGEKRRKSDLRKDAFLTGLGWKVLRFSNRMILKRPHQVLSELLSTISMLKSTTPIP